MNEVRVVCVVFVVDAQVFNAFLKANVFFFGVFFLAGGVVEHAGLLTHMEQMRMEPKHQFAAQYMLSRAAAERRSPGRAGGTGDRKSVV